MSMVNSTANLGLALFAQLRFVASLLDIPRIGGYRQCRFGDQKSEVFGTLLARGLLLADFPKDSQG